MPHGFLVETFATERLKTLTVWSQFHDADLDFRPAELARSVREQLVHQCLSEDAWCTNMLGLPVTAVPRHHRRALAVDHPNQRGRRAGPDPTHPGGIPMKFMLLIYIDGALYDALPDGRADAMMRDCLSHADELRRDGHLIESQMLEDAPTAKSVRIRNGRTTATDGPFAESKEVLGGFNLIEARDMDEAVQIAAHFPWARTGCVEIRPVRDIATVRERVSAGSRSSA